jgi:actin-related protein 5
MMGPELITQFMVRETCYFATNYEEEIRSMGDPAVMGAQTTVVQFPYTEAVSYYVRLKQPKADPQVVVEKSEAEISAAAEKRIQNGKRLQDMQAKARAEKVS